VPRLAGKLTTFQTKAINSASFQITLAWRLDFTPFGGSNSDARVLVIHCMTKVF
jgi:hypothetical protein